MGWIKEMNWWMVSLDTESCKKYNVAARWAPRQYGVVRAGCEEFEPDELLGTPAETMTAWIQVKQLSVWQLTPSLDSRS